MDPSAKLTWMMIFAIAPLPGAVFLFFTRWGGGHTVPKKKVEEQIARSRKYLNQPYDVLKKVEHDGSGTDDLCCYLNRSGCFPLFDHSTVTYFPLGENKFEAMLEELEKAEGIKSKPFSPITPFVSSHYNYRDHRKILVIDGKVAFNGGVNLADEYINRIERFGHWKDTALMVKGAAVRSYTLMFLQMWNIGEKEPDYERWFREDSGTVRPAEEGDALLYSGEKEYDMGYVMPYCDCPLDDDKAGEMVYIDILNRATDYVHIMTPYLILDEELATALRFAAQRGVDVRLILPGIPDKAVPYALAKTHYGSLTKAGVKIYEYTPGFVHAKVFVSDDTKAVVGTINLDYRSLYHHFECATYMYRTPCIAEIEADFQDTLKKCRQVTADTIREEKISTKIVGRTIKFLAPLM